MNWDRATITDVLTRIEAAEKKNRSVTVSTKWLRKILATLEKIARGHDVFAVFVAEDALKGIFHED
jgi:hypothetical protein